MIEPQSSRRPVKPPSTPKSSTPQSTLGINLSKTWHSTPTQLALLEVEPKSKCKRCVGTRRCSFHF
jgi:hypothetical protein